MAVSLTRKDHVAHVILNRPEKRNAFTLDMWAQLETIWNDISKDTDLWVVIISAKGEHFTVGSDLKELVSMYTDNPEKQARDSFWSGSIANAIPSNITKPVIAAVKGYCIGIGSTLVSSCDIVVASESAVFSFPEVKIGLPTVAGSWWLPKKIPMNIASEILLTGRNLPAEEAHRYGLVNYLTPAEDVLDKAEAIAQQICKNAPLAVWATKEMISRGVTLTFEEVSRLGTSVRTILFHSEDSKEGPLAFVEKRTPQYKAR